MLLLNKARQQISPAPLYNTISISYKVSHGDQLFSHSACIFSNPYAWQPIYC